MDRRWLSKDQVTRDNGRGGKKWLQFSSVARRKKNEPYWIQYTDHLGKRKTAKGFTDKGLTEQLAGKLETEARFRKTGMIDGEQERYALERQAPIADHLNKFEESSEGHTGKHVKLTMGRIRRIVAGCNFATLSDITPEAVQSFLRSMRQDRKYGYRAPHL